MTPTLLGLKNITGGVKPYLYRYFIKKFNLSILEEDLAWVLAYADLRRSGRFAYYVKLFGRLILFLCSVPFLIWHRKHLIYKEHATDSIVLNRQHPRENFIYKNYVKHSSEFSFQKKHDGKKIHDFILVFFISVISDFYYIRKSHELAAIICYFEKKQNSLNLTNKKFYVHDGANPGQRFLSIYIRALKSRFLEL